MTQQQSVDDRTSLAITIGELLISDLPLPGCSLGLDALVPSRLGVRLNVGNFGEFLRKQNWASVAFFERR